MRRVAASTCSNLSCSFDRQLQDLHNAVRLASRGRTRSSPSRKDMLAWLTPTRSARSTTDRLRAIRASRK